MDDFIERQWSKKVWIVLKIHKTNNDLTEVIGVYYTEKEANVIKDNWKHSDFIIKINSRILFK